MKRQTRQKLPQLIAAAAAFGLGLAGLGYMGIQTLGQVSADEYGCYADIPGSQTAVIIDSSEPRWDKTMQRAIETYFHQTYHRLGFNELLSVYTTQLGKIASVAAPSFHVCGQASSPQQLPDNAEQAQAGFLKRQQQRLYNEVFKPELDAVLALDIPDDQRQVYESPIFEMIRAVQRAAVLREGDKLVVVSDGIQSTESARFCSVKGAMPSFKIFKQSRIYQARFKPRSLNGVQVEFLFLQRGGYGQGGLAYCASEEELQAFWRGFFYDVGARVDFIRIRSGAEG